MLLLRFRKERVNTMGNRDGDIGEPEKWITLEPVEVPIEVPQPEKVPERG